MQRMEIRGGSTAIGPGRKLCGHRLPMESIQIMNTPRRWDVYYSDVWRLVMYESGLCGDAPLFVHTLPEMQFPFTNTTLNATPFPLPIENTVLDAKATDIKVGRYIAI